MARARRRRGGAARAPPARRAREAHRGSLRVRRRRRRRSRSAPTRRVHCAPARRARRSARPTASTAARSLAEVAARARAVRRRDRARALRRPARRRTSSSRSTRCRPAALVERYERAQAQAVLLRAVRVTVDVRCASAPRASARSFGASSSCACSTRSRRHGDGLPHRHRRPLQPLRVGHQVRPAARARARRRSTACDAWRLEADIRWGKERTPLVFRLAGGVARSAGATRAAPARRGRARSFAASRALETPWRVSAEHADPRSARRRLVVPDLVFERRAREAARARLSRGDGVLEPRRGLEARRARPSAAWPSASSSPSARSCGSARRSWTATAGRALRLQAHDQRPNDRRAPRKARCENPDLLAAFPRRVPRADPAEVVGPEVEAAVREVVRDGPPSGVGEPPSLPARSSAPFQVPMTKASVP